MKKILFILPLICFVASCSNFDDGIARKDFLKKCKDCKIVDMYSEECKDGSVFSCMLVKINYTENSDTLKSVMCQYIKDDNGNWHMSE